MEQQRRRWKKHYHVSSGIPLCGEEPTQNVLVIDLCPQSNSSMMLLGGGATGEQHVLDLCTQATPKTLVGYLSTVISNGAGAALPSPQDYLVKAKQFNGHMPSSLYLLCGDGNLEPMSPAITGAAAAPPLTPTSQPWKWVHLIFKDFIENTAKHMANADWMVLIDTNPSFSIYTELAISAADRLITPVNADDSSRVATNAMFILLHGQTPPIRFMDRGHTRPRLSPTQSIFPRYTLWLEIG